MLHKWVKMIYKTPEKLVYFNNFYENGGIIRLNDLVLSTCLADACLNWETKTPDAGDESILLLK